MTDQAKGLLITAFGVLMIVPDSLLIRLISMDTPSVVFWRSLLTGSAVLAGLFMIYGFGAVERTRAIGRYGLAYAGLMIISAIFFVLSIRLTSVANTVFILATMPVFAAIFSRVWLGERISRRMVFTMLAVMTGIAVIAFGSTKSETSSLLGDFIALCVAMAFGLAMTVARRAKGVSMIPAIPISFLGSAALVFPFADPFTFTGFDPVYVALLGGVFIPLSMTCLAIGPRFITSAEVALMILLESVLAPLLVWLVLGEDPGQWALIGGAIVLGTLFLSNLVAMKRAEPVA
jgi:drug/metabolite transporter (DMT)-like permease